MAKRGMRYLSKLHGINTTGSCQIVQRWINAYKEFDDAGVFGEDLSKKCFIITNYLLYWKK